jgi:hypothetical protein
MATLPLGYSLLEETNKNKSNNKTIRRKRTPVNSKKVKQFLNFMKDSENEDNDSQDEKHLANFNPPSNPLLPSQRAATKDNGYPDKMSSVTAFCDDDDDEEQDRAIGTEGFKSLDTNNTNNATNTNNTNNANYYKPKHTPQINNANISGGNSHYVPSYNNLTTNPAIAANTDANGLMKKLNYMIHLLEEQQDEKTENITEELVLYLFLGVFVIFVCDSFTRVGKYKR